MSKVTVEHSPGSGYNAYCWKCQHYLGPWTPSKAEAQALANEHKREGH